MVKHGSWEEFLNDGTFVALYKPKGTIDSYGRGRVVDMGRLLATENIGYVLNMQIFHDKTTGYVQPEDPILLRCDGVVEYCYEWFNFRIYGSDSKWDITLASNKSHHVIAYITPKKQAQDYMTFIQINEP